MTETDKLTESELTVLKAIANGNGNMKALYDSTGYGFDVLDTLIGRLMNNNMVLISKDLHVSKLGKALLTSLSKDV